MLILSIISFAGCAYMYFKSDADQRRIILATMLYMFGLYCLGGA